MEKITFEIVKNGFEAKGCTLLSTEYKTAKSKLRYICSCGREREICWDKMRHGQGKCPECRSSYLKNSYEYVKSVFEERGFILLSKEYKNGNQKLKFICTCGREAESTFSQIQQGKLCGGCRAERIGRAHRLSIEEVLKICEENGHQFLEKTYSNISKKIKVTCKCGRIYFTTLNSIKNGHCCKECANEAQNKGVGEFGWALYDTYHPKFSFCEETRRDPIHNHVLNVKCAYCQKWFIPKVSAALSRSQALIGKTHGESRFYCSDECKQSCPVFYQQTWPKGFNKTNTRPGQKEFRDMVLERDNYTCQKCGHQDLCGDFLIAHHIDPVACNPIESMDIDNGITLCETCHKEVHQLDGCRLHELRAASF